MAKNNFLAEVTFKYVWPFREDQALKGQQQQLNGMETFRAQ